MHSKPVPPRGSFVLLSAFCLLTAVGSQAWNAKEVATHYTKYEHRIPMRDGVRLHTTVFLPKDEPGPLPVLITRTPYSARPYGSSAFPDWSGSAEVLAKDRFILVLQDVRGRNASDGEFVHMRPFRTDKAALTDIDESTDAWDTIEWIIRNVPGHNGRVGMMGISYPGFYTSMAVIRSHPALKAASPQAPIADWFIGDDFHHNGAFFLPHAFNFLAVFGQSLEDPKHDDPRPFRHGTPDGYDFFLQLGPLSNADARYFKGRIAFWSDLAAHPNYDAFWRARNIRPHLRDVGCAVMTVGGWFDAEDLFGALETYRSIESQNPGVTNQLVMGPWVHGGWGFGEGDRIGAVTFRAATAQFYREKIELPFFRKHLKGDATVELPEAHVFETGTDQWRRFEQWPPAGVTRTSWFLHPEGRLATSPPREGDGTFDEFPSDPAKPVPFLGTTTIGMAVEYMVADQRFAASRPDVLVYATPELEEDLTLAGPIEVDLQVSTTGTDADWVVKLIDVYDPRHPDADPNPTNERLGGYQQLVRGEPMRGRFRNSYEHPEPFEPGKVTRVRWVMPDVFHTFRRGHRLMVQVQSSWFPLVDRNPQTFVENIWDARPEDFRRAQHRVYRGGAAVSSISAKVLPQRKGSG